MSDGWDDDAEPKKKLLYFLHENFLKNRKNNKDKSVSRGKSFKRGTSKKT